MLYNGNVGIGTTSPAGDLQVVGGNPDIYFTCADTGQSDLYFGGVTAPTKGNIKYSDNADVFVFSVNTNTEAMRIISSGSIGIGTTSPSTKLDVNGTFQATSVRSTGGGDGGFILRQWTQSSGYASLTTNGMSGLEYCMISDGTNTFVGAGTGGILKLRGPANDSSPEILLNGTDVEINTGDLKIPDGSLAVGNISNSATDGRIDASNDVVAFSTSDIRLKDNIKSIDKALDKVNSIQGIEFDWIEKEEVHGNSGHDIGVIAQEIEKILPDVVTTRDSGYKAVKYEKIVPLLIEAIKDLSKQVDGLKRLI